MTIPKTMKAAVQRDGNAVVERVQVPRPKETEVLVRVHASALNRADLGLVAGGAHGVHGGAGTVLGLEWSGEVVETGSAVPGIRVGDRVMCSGIGGFAEYAVTDWRRTFALPTAGMSYAEGACLPIALRTMHNAIATNGRFARGQTILIQGASSGVGLMGLQIAKLLGASLVIGTSTTAGRRSRLPAFGADVAIDTTSATWTEEVLEHTRGRGVDLLVDQLSGPYMSQNLKATAIGGRIINVGRMAGQTAPFDFETHSLRRIQYIGVTFRTRTIEEVAEIAEAVRRELWPTLEAGGLRLPIDVQLPLDEVAKACELMRDNAHFGKIILTQSAG